MIDVKTKYCCEESCYKRASFNYINKRTPIYCITHKKTTMINVTYKKCKTVLCGITVQKKYDGYCLRCYTYLFPDKPTSRNYKTKEQAVIEYIQEEFKDKTITYDKRIIDGCSLKRPDVFIDLGYQVVIIEVDENQHNTYDCTCENKRIMELSKDVGHRPIVFIRFNPDDYINTSNINIKSCWGINASGICVVKKSSKKEWEERLSTLKNTVQYWFDNKTEKTIETIQLFYDQV